MAGNQNRVVVKFLADTDSMRRGIQQTNTQLSTFSKSVKKAGIALGAAFGAREVAQFVGTAVTSFADLNEQLSKTEVVFGENADTIKKWSENSVDALLSTQEEALNYASTLGFILDQSGFSADETARLAQELTQLTADLASLNNRSVEQAFTAVRGAIVGEREALKTLGVVIQEVDVKNEALRLGLVKTGEELTANAKAQANISLLMQKTAVAQGDVARTGDSLANQMKKIRAETQELTTAFGEGLVQGFGDTSDTGQELIDTMRRLRPLVKGIGTAIGESTGAFQELISAVDAVSEGLDELSGGAIAAEGGLIGIGIEGIKAAFGLNVLEDALAGVVATQRAFNRAIRDQSSIGGSGSPLDEKDLMKSGDAISYIGSELGYTNEAMTEWTLKQRDIQRANKELQESFGGVGGAAKDTADEMDEAARIIEEEFQRVLEETQQQLDDWRRTITDKMDLGSAFREANDATARMDALKIELAELKADPNATQEAIQALEKELAEAGKEAGKGFLTFFAEQATDAEQLARNLANLDAAGLNQAIIQQIASDANGAALSQAIVDGITADGYGVLDQLNRQAARIENAGVQLGETLVEPLPQAGAQGGEDFLFGIKGGGKEKNGLLNQVKSDAPKVKKAIQNSLRTSVEVKVIYTPDTSRLEGAPGGRSVVRSLQDFERLNGRKWRDRVR